MKQIRKISCLLLALVMVLSLSVTAFAAGTGTGDGDEPMDERTGGDREIPTDGVINISGSEAGHEYNAYQMFRMSYNKATSQYSYTVVDERWMDFFSTSGAGSTYFAVDSATKVAKWINSDTTPSTAGEMARLAIAYVEKWNTDHSDNKINPAASATVPENQTSCSIRGLEPGYYLLDSTMGTIVMVNSNDGDGNVWNVTEKNVAPSVTKQVAETDNNGSNVFGTSNDAAVGDYVQFRSIIRVQPGTEKLIFHDEMSQGLTFINDTAHPVNVVLSGQEAKATPTRTTTGWEVLANDLTDACDFHIEFDKENFLDTIVVKDSTITITYYAQVNENAVKEDSSTNSAKLQYSNKDHYTPQTDNTVTKTWELPIFKYKKGDGDTKVPLGGAKFQLQKDTAGNKVMYFKATTTTTGDVTTTTYVYQGTLSSKTDSVPTGMVTEFVSPDGTGLITLDGLDSGTYYLVETEAPQGFNPMGGSLTVDIKSNGKITTGLSPVEHSQAEVLNQSGNRLPQTGGIGTTIFYVVGSVMLVGAGILLITKKRMSVEG